MINLMYSKDHVEKFWEAPIDTKRETLCTHTAMGWGNRKWWGYL